MIIKAQNLNLESKEKSKRILIIFNILLLTFIIFWFYIRKIQRDHIKILFFKENLLDKTIEDGSWETPTAHGDDTAQDYLTDEEQPAEYYQEISAIKRKKLYHDLRWSNFSGHKNLLILCNHGKETKKPTWAITSQVR